MTLSSGLPARAQRRPGRPPGSKRANARELPGKIRASEYRSSRESSENSNDSGLGYDHQHDLHHHTIPMSERLNWPGDRSMEAKRMRMDIKEENDDAIYCFPTSNGTRQSKENTSLIRTAPASSVSCFNIANSTSTTTSRSHSRGGIAASNRQSSTSPVTLLSQHSATSQFGDITLTIIKQPEQQHRARYQTEGSRGAVKDRDGNGFPVVQLRGYYKPATLQVYIGTDVGKVSPHMFYQACKVSGKNSTPCVEKKIDGTCVIELALDPTKEMSATCDCVGILKERNVDVEHRFPEQLGNRSKKKSTRCRMIFRTTITHDNGTQETLQVGSQPIVCTQPPGIPEICKKSLTSCPASGGLELFVLGKNFLKDTRVIFQQYDQSEVVWEQSVVPDKEYLQQTHFVCVVPPYRRTNITEPVRARLCVVSSGKTSESQPFMFTPVNGAVPSVHLEAQHATAQPSHFFKGALWQTRKLEQDLDMMPPPESNLVPMSTRRPSINMPSSSDSHSPPASMKQEYIDENSESAVSDVMDVHRERFRHISESSLDVNHDSNISMLNDSEMMRAMSDNSNCSINTEDSIDVVRRNSIGSADASLKLGIKESLIAESCRPIMHPVVNEMRCLTPASVQPTRMSPSERVMDLRMKLAPMNDVPDYLATASSIATLKRFGVEPSGATLPTQSAQSVENYLTKIESKPTLTNNINTGPFPTNKVVTSLLEPASQTVAQPAYLNSQKLSPVTETLTAATSPNVILPSTLEPTIPTLSENDLVSSSLETHLIRSASVGSKAEFIANKVAQMTQAETVLGQPNDILNTTASLLNSPEIPNKNNTTPLSPEQAAIINSDITASIISRTSHTMQQDSLMQAATNLPAICQTTTVQGPLMPATTERALLGNVTSTTTTAIDPMLITEPENALLLTAAVDMLKTKQEICEMQVTSPTAAPNLSPVQINTFVPRFPTSSPVVDSESEMTPAKVAKTLIEEPEQLLDAAVELLQTTKKISELTTSPNEITAPSNAVMSPVLATQVQRNIGTSFVSPFTNATSMETEVIATKISKPEFMPVPVKDINNSLQNDKKNEDRMIPQSFTALSENELINYINPNFLDQV